MEVTENCDNSQRGTIGDVLPKCSRNEGAEASHNGVTNYFGNSKHGLIRDSRRNFLRDEEVGACAEYQLLNFCHYVSWRYV